VVPPDYRLVTSLSNRDRDLENLKHPEAALPQRMDSWPKTFAKEKLEESPISTLSQCKCKYCSQSLEKQDVFCFPLLFIAVF
jgi:hypothetical protein